MTGEPEQSMTGVAKEPTQSTKLPDAVARQVETARLLQSVLELAKRNGLGKLATMVGVPDSTIHDNEGRSCKSLLTDIALKLKELELSNKRLPNSLKKLIHERKEVEAQIKSLAELALYAPLAGPRGRGRRPKRRFMYPLSIAGLPSEEDRRSLAEAVRDICPQPERKTKLCNELAHALGHFRAARGLQLGRKGRPRKHAVQILLSDCRLAWARATGRRAGLWQEETAKCCLTYPWRESRPVELARIVMKIAGDVSPDDLRRQLTQARRVSRSPK